MNEELQNKVFTWVSQTADKIGEWGGKEIPSFITEFLTWRFYENAINISLYGMFACLVLFILFKYLIPLAKKCYTEDNKYGMDDGSIMLALMLSFTITLGMIVIFPLQEIKDCVKIKIAPKVYLVEEAAKLIK